MYPDWSFSFLHQDEQVPWFDKHFISTFFSPFWWVLLLCPFSILVKSLEVLSSACSKLFLKIKIPHIKINICQGVLYFHPVFCIFKQGVLYLHPDANPRSGANSGDGCCRRYRRFFDRGQDLPPTGHNGFAGLVNLLLF